MAKGGSTRVRGSSDDEEWQDGGASCGCVLPSSGVMHLFGEVSGQTVQPLILYLHSVREDRGMESLQLYVNSDGGSFEDGFALVDAILSSPVPVDTVCLGRACSVALPIFLSGRVRYIGQHAYTMFHGVSVDGVAGVAGSLKNMATEADHCNKMMTGYVCSRSHVSPSILKRAVAKGLDLYFYPEGMVANGMAHGIGAVPR